MGSFRQWWCLIALSLLFGGASLANLGSAYQPLSSTVILTRWALIAGGLAMFLPLLLRSLHSITLTNRAVWAIVFWLLFAGTSLVSSVATGDPPEALFSGVWLFAGVPIMLFVAIPQILGNKSIYVVVTALLLSQSLYLVVSFFLYPEFRFLYKGIFGHPNELGVTGAVVATCCLAFLTEFAETKGRLLALIGLTVGIVFSSFVVVMSGSRTSMLAVLISIVLAVGTGYRSHRRRTYHLFAGMSILVAAASLGMLAELDITQQFWQKHMQHVVKGDPLSRRDEIWMKVIEDIQPLGNGANYFPGTVGISSHNSAMFILGQRGPVAAGAMIVLALIALFWAFRDAASRLGRQFKAAPLLISASFWTLSMGEGMFGSFGTGITMAYLIIVGVLLHKEPVRSRPPQYILGRSAIPGPA